MIITLGILFTLVFGLSGFKVKGGYLFFSGVGILSLALGLAIGLFYFGIFAQGYELFIGTTILGSAAILFGVEDYHNIFIKQIKLDRI